MRNSRSIYTWDFRGGVVRFRPPAVLRKISASSRRLCCCMAQDAVVQLPCGVVSSARSISPSSSIPPSAGEFHSPVVRNVQAIRLDVVRDMFRGKGFSTCAAGFLPQSLRPSTSLVYDRKWDISCTWCTERQIDPVSISIWDLGDFLPFLYEDLSLAASTVRTYKAAILSAVSPRQIFTPAQMGMLNKLCIVFHRRRPAKPSPIPA